MKKASNTLIEIETLPLLIAKEISASKITY